MTMTPIPTKATEGEQEPLSTKATEGAQTPLATEATERAQTPLATEATERAHAPLPEGPASPSPAAHTPAAEQTAPQAKTPEISFSTLLSQAASLLQLVIAYAFFLSVMHMVTFFNTIKLNPLYIPLTFTDYVVDFCAWVYPVIYLAIVVGLTIIVASITQQMAFDRMKFFILVVIGFLIVIMTIELFSVARFMSVLSLFIVAIFIFIFFQFKTFFDLAKYFVPSILALLIIATIGICFYFSQDEKEALREAMQYKQTFTHGSTTIEGYYLRAFEKGRLVRTCDEEKSTLFFLPHNKDEQLLQFPSLRACSRP